MRDILQNYLLKASYYLNALDYIIVGITNDNSSHTIWEPARKLVTFQHCKGNFQTDNILGGTISEYDIFDGWTQ